MLTKPNSYQLVLENGQLILRLLPGLTEAPWSEIEQAGFEAVSEVQKVSKPQVVVDLTQLSYIGSSQVALVIRVWKAVKVQDGALVVATSNSTVREVLALSGLDRVWKLVETSQEAQAALGRRDIQPTLDDDQSDASPLPAYALLAACVVGILGLIAYGMDAIAPGRILLVTGGVMALAAGVWGLLTTFGTLRLFAGSGVSAGIVLVLISFILPQPKAEFRRNESEGQEATAGAQAASPVPAKVGKPKVNPPKNELPNNQPAPTEPSAAVNATNEPPKATAPTDAADSGLASPATKSPAPTPATEPAGSITPRSSLKDL